MSAAVDWIDALLPQTQCRQCGFAGCRPYAQAIAAGQAAINRCPPGGGATIEALARLTGQARLPLDERCGTERPVQVAFVVEPLCIGCTKCLQACPVDAISGAAGWLHTVVPALCTGCGLCVAPCPVDCIEMHDPVPPRAWTRAHADDARARHAARARRLAQEQAEREQRLARKALAGAVEAPTLPAGASAFSAQAPAGQASPPLAARSSAAFEAPATSAEVSTAALARKRAVIEAAVERARRRAAARVPRSDGPPAAPTSCRP